MSGSARREAKQLRIRLLGDSESERTTALDRCVELGDPDLAPMVVDALDRLALRGSERDRALAFLHSLGLAFPLDGVRADGWLDRLGEGVGGFHEACDIVGRNFLGLATLLGVHLTSIEVQPDDFDRTRIGFTLGDERSEELPLREFRRRLVSAVLEDRPVFPEVELPLDAERVMRLFGGRHLLLAGLFDWSVRWVFFPGPPRRFPDVRVDLLQGGNLLCLTLDILIDRLHEEVRVEWDRHQDPLSGVDRRAIDEATVFLAESPAKVLERLGGLMRYVLDYGRNGGGPPPDPERMALVCEGLSLLGRAHAALGPTQSRYGEEVLRLGLQMLPGAPGCHHLHLALGELLVGGGRDAEALAHLRRALVLGAAADLVETRLAEAYFRAGRLVAAAVLLSGLERRAPEAAARLPGPVAETLHEQARPVFDALDALGTES